MPLARLAAAQAALAGEGVRRVRGGRRLGRVPEYDLLVDGERVARLDSEEEVRAWLARYREEHEEDDPAAVHVQILERGTLAWLTGGRLVPREEFRA